MDNQEYNEKLNQELERGYVSSNTLKSFEEAYEYEAASTTNWLIKKFQILLRAVNQGTPVNFEDGAKTVKTLDGLNEWVSERFPDIIDDLFKSNK